MVSGKYLHRCKQTFRRISLFSCSVCLPSLSIIPRTGGFSGDPYRGGCVEKGLPFSCGPEKPCPAGEACIRDDFVGENVCICARGYARDLQTGKCRDIDECTELREKPACGLNAVCKNMPGSYDCQCPSGFNGNPFSLCEGKFLQNMLEISF